MNSIRKVVALFIWFVSVYAITGLVLPDSKDDKTGENLKKLRELMLLGQGDSGKVSAYIIPNEDEHQVFLFKF